MGIPTSTRVGARGPQTTEAPWVRWTLTVLALGFMALFLVLPLLAVFAEALRKGWDAYWSALPRNSNLAIAHAAATPNTRLSGTAIAAVSSVSRTAAQASGSCKALQ